MSRKWPGKGNCDGCYVLLVAFAAIVAGGSWRGEGTSHQRRGDVQTQEG